MLWWYYGVSISIQILLKVNLKYKNLQFYIPAEDAVLAVEHGASGILVSNHGGRQLDGVPATVNT